MPLCDCGGIVKPDVVLYEESLDQDVMYRAARAIHDADLDSATDMLPETTLDYFRSPEAAPIVAAIRRAQNVVHH